MRSPAVLFPVALKGHQPGRQPLPPLTALACRWRAGDTALQPVHIALVPVAAPDVCNAENVYEDQLVGPWGLQTPAAASDSSPASLRALRHRRRTQI